MINYRIGRIMLFMLFWSHSACVFILSVLYSSSINDPFPFLVFILIVLARFGLSRVIDFFHLTLSDETPLGIQSQER